MSTDIRQQIEKILKEIYHGYRFMEKGEYRLHSYVLYYKKKNGSLDYEPLSTNVLLKNNYDEMRQIIFNPQLEYALFVNEEQVITPSFDCFVRDIDILNSLIYLNALMQFIPHMACVSSSHNTRCDHVVTQSFVEKVMRIEPLCNNKDPLSQIFEYKQLFSHSWPSNVYVCSRLYIVEPYSSDITSIFHGKYGIVAYCMTLRDLVLMERYSGEISFVRSIDNIWSRILEKVRSCGLIELWKRDKMEACDIDTITRVMSVEIQEANSLMQKYGIVRVAFPLD